jgi:serine/threonine-protein kinase
VKTNPRPQTTTTPPPPAADGTLLAVAVGGSCAFSVNGTSKGTSQSIRVSLKPGTYSVICKPDGASPITKTVPVKSGETAMAAFKL